MIFSDLALARRIERAEGTACLRFAQARQRLFPESGAAWMEYAGANVVFDGAGSPITQTFGLGLFEELTAPALDVIERFFFDRGAPVHHEVSPLAGVSTIDLLCSRNYRPMEISSVLYRPVEKPEAIDAGNIRVRVAHPAESELWADVSTRGWTHEHPEFTDFLRNMSAMSFAREGGPCFLAELDGQPGAAGSLCLHEGVALFAGAATVPELRRRGLQGALLRERLRYAFEHGCDLAVMIAEAGSESQRNAERKGLRIAYTRTKWRLDSSQRDYTG